MLQLEVSLHRVLGQGLRIQRDEATVETALSADGILKVGDEVGVAGGQVGEDQPTSATGQLGPVLVRIGDVVLHMDGEGREGGEGGLALLTLDGRLEKKTRIAEDEAISPGPVMCVCVSFEANSTATCRIYSSRLGRPLGIAIWP